MSENPDFEDTIQRIASADVRFQHAVDAGLVLPPEIKAHEARRVEMIAQLDTIRGTVDVTYAQFRDAFERGASCNVLFEIRNKMHPDDPLKADANDDLRGIGCFSPKSTRTDPPKGSPLP